MQEAGQPGLGLPLHHPLRARPQHQVRPRGPLLQDADVHDDPLDRHLRRHLLRRRLRLHGRLQEEDRRRHTHRRREGPGGRGLSVDPEQSSHE